jgi:acetyl esterase/lipase
LSWLQPEFCQPRRFRHQATLFNSPTPTSIGRSTEKAHRLRVSAPGRDIGEQTSAILLFHGGGWNAGSAEWVFEAAGRFASLGMVAVAVDYRLSKGNITPIEALDDTRAAFRWVRRKAAEFNIDPKHVAGYGVSAGGHGTIGLWCLSLPCVSKTLWPGIF